MRDNLEVINQDFDFFWGFDIASKFLNLFCSI